MDNTFSSKMKMIRKDLEQSIGPLDWEEKIEQYTAPMSGNVLTTDNLIRIMEIQRENGDEKYTGKFPSSLANLVRLYYNGKLARPRTGNP